MSIYDSLIVGKELRNKKKIFSDKCRHDAANSNGGEYTVSVYSIEHRVVVRAEDGA